VNGADQRPTFGVEVLAMPRVMIPGVLTFVGFIGDPTDAVSEVGGETARGRYREDSHEWSSAHRNGI
jgi:hypothetical protein